MPMSLKHINALKSHKEPMTFDNLYMKLGYVYIGSVYDNPHYFEEFGIKVRNEDLAFFTFVSLAVNVVDEGFLYTDFGTGRNRFFCEFTQDGIDQMLGLVNKVG